MGEVEQRHSRQREQHGQQVVGPSQQGGRCSGGGQQAPQRSEQALGWERGRTW